MQLADVFPDSKIIIHDEEKLLAIGSQDIHQSAIDALATHGDLDGLVFYCGFFHDIDLSVLHKMNINRISFLDGNIADRELEQLSGIQSLRQIKLLNTRVTKSGITAFKNARPDVNIDFKGLAG